MCPTPPPPQPSHFLVDPNDVVAAVCVGGNRVRSRVDGVGTGAAVMLFSGGRLCGSVETTKTTKFFLERESVVVGMGLTLGLVADRDFEFEPESELCHQIFFTVGGKRRWG